MSRWVNLSGNRLFAKLRIALLGLFSVLIFASLQCSQCSTEPPSSFGEYLLDAFSIDNTDIIVSTSMRFGAPPLSVSEKDPSLENTATAPRRIFVIQYGGSRHNRLKSSRRLEHLGVTARQLFDALPDKLREGGVDALNAYWEEVHRFYPEIALLIPPKSTIALPWR